jgi:predicted dienelactone hydrolase
MSVDRVLTKTLRVGQRLTDALLGNEGRSAPHDDDSPLANLRSLLGQPPPDLPDTAGEAYKAEPGPYAIDFHHQVFRDRKQGREVPLSVLYPLGSCPPGGFPTVVVSPGLGARAQATRYLERHLASHGYVVLCPTHQGSDWLAVCLRTPFGAFSRRELLTRVSEVSLAAQLLQDRELPEQICRKADGDRLALVGHSFGALTIQAVAGVPVLGPDGRQLPLGDPRFRAFVCMSPYGDSFPAKRLGMTAEGYARIDRPVLFMSGDRDDLWTVGRGPNTHLGPYRWVSTPDRYHLLISDTKHSDFSQVFGRIKKRTATMINSTTVAFLDAYLKELPKARHYLRHDLQVVASLYQSWAFLGDPPSPLAKLDATATD